MKKFDPIDANDVVKAVKGVLYVGSERITEVELNNLKQEVRALKNFRIWRLMQETVRWAAIEKGMITSEEWEHTLSAKMMLFNLDVLKNIVNAIDSYTIPHIEPPKKKTGVSLL